MVPSLPGLKQMVGPKIPSEKVGSGISLAGAISPFKGELMVKDIGFCDPVPNSLLKKPILYSNFASESCQIRSQASMSECVNGILLVARM